MADLSLEHPLRPIRGLVGYTGTRIWYLGASGSLPSVWGSVPHITYSEYFDDCPSGEYRDGVLCQNVECLSFPDESFDLVISEDVFEHVADYRQGFREVHRVLSPIGRHVFTVPLEFTARSMPRFAREGDTYVPVLPLYTHGDPVRGSIPVHTHFGLDLVTFLEDVGFRTFLHVAQYDDMRRFGAYDSYTFITRKR